jgi:Leucine-rich repeat (LRR) protein
MCQICTGEYDENTTKLDCYVCRQVTSIPSTLVNLRELYCRDTNVTSIPSTLINLRVLACGDTKVTLIPSTLVNLRELYCSYTKVTSIPSTLVNLIYLYCNNTKVTSIPDLPILQVLYCRNTPVTYIPLGIQYSYSNNCPWLEIENITKLIPIQKRWKYKFKIRRVKELLEYFYPDIISLIL